MSVARIWNHVVLAARFSALARRSVVDGPPDVAFIGLPPAELAWAAVRAAHRHRAPAIVDVRDLYPDALMMVMPRRLHALARPLMALLAVPTRRALRGADDIVAISESYLAWATNRARAPVQGGHVVPLGYPAVESHPRGRGDLSMYGIDAHRPVVWFAGTFGRSYDFEVMVDAAAALAVRGAPHQIVLSGDGERMREVRSRAERIPNVVLTGWLGAAELAAIADVATCGLLAYVEDAPQSLPNKLFEYLSHGLPVLTNLRGEASELVTDTGCGTMFRNGAELADLVVRLSTDDSARDRMAKAARSVFDQRFSGDAVTRALVAHIEAAPREGCRTSGPAGAPAD